MASVFLRWRYSVPCGYGKAGKLLGSGVLWNLTALSLWEADGFQENRCLLPMYGLRMYCIIDLGSSYLEESRTYADHCSSVVVDQNFTEGHNHLTASIEIFPSKRKRN